jgi:hypothetical protein
MEDNYLLKEKYRIQEKLAEESDFNIKRYLDMLDERLKEIEKKYHIIFKKGKLHPVD